MRALSVRRIEQAVIVAGPGFTKDALLEYMLAQSDVLRSNRCVTSAAACLSRGTARDATRVRSAKFVLAAASSGHKHALEEVMGNQAVMRQLADVRVAKHRHRLAL